MNRCEWGKLYKSLWVLRVEKHYMRIQQFSNVTQQYNNQKKDY